MKVYISADIEGTAGIASWSATNLGDPEHRAAAQEMTLEAVAACQGALREPGDGSREAGSAPRRLLLAFGQGRGRGNIQGL